MAKSKISVAGNDVKDWTTDDSYFSRVFKKFSESKTKADGSEMEEKVLTKEEA